MSDCQGMLVDHSNVCHAEETRAVFETPREVVHEKGETISGKRCVICIKSPTYISEKLEYAFGCVLVPFSMSDFQVPIRIRIVSDV